MSSLIKAIIFDCDGTLVDSETHSLQVLVDLIAEFGLEVTHEEALERFSGHELSVVFAEFEERLGRKLPGDFLQQFRTRQLPVLAERVTAIDGAGPLLASLTVPFCVASNAPLNKVTLCLKTAKLDGHFPAERRFSAYEVEKWKPDPALFLMAAERLGVAPEHCAVVEDSRFGVQAGLNAGMQTFAYDPHRQFTDRQDVTSVQRLAELSKWFPTTSE